MKDFAFAMFVGVAIGAYSSIFIAAPVLTIVHERQVRRAAGTAAKPARVPAAAAVATAGAVDAAATKATAGMGGGAKPKPKSKPRNKKGQPAKRKRR